VTPMMVSGFILNYSLKIGKTVDTSKSVPASLPEHGIPTE